MPTDYIKTIAKEQHRSINSLEKIWNIAKEKAKKEDKEDNYAYITQIFKNMAGITESIANTYAYLNNENKTTLIESIIKAMNICFESIDNNQLYIISGKNNDNTDFEYKKDNLENALDKINELKDQGLKPNLELLNIDKGTKIKCNNDGSIIKEQNYVDKNGNSISKTEYDKNNKNENINISSIKIESTNDITYNKTIQVSYDSRENNFKKLIDIFKSKNDGILIIDTDDNSSDINAIRVNKEITKNDGNRIREYEVSYKNNEDKNNSDNEKCYITVTSNEKDRVDQEINNFKKLFVLIGKIGNAGHSFNIKFIPNSTHADIKNIYWDGDGTDYINIGSIKIK